MHNTEKKTFNWVLQYNNTILSTVYYSANSCSKNQMKGSKHYFPVVPFCYETWLRRPFIWKLLLVSSMIKSGCVSKTKFKLTRLVNLNLVFETHTWHKEELSYEWSSQSSLITKWNHRKVLLRCFHLILRTTVSDDDDEIMLVCC